MNKQLAALVYHDCMEEVERLKRKIKEAKRIAKRAKRIADRSDIAAVSIAKIREVLK